MLAFGKTIGACPGISGSGRGPGQVVQEGQRAAPLVLAKIGPAAVPCARPSATPNPVVRRQAVRTLRLGGDTAGSARAEMEIALTDKDAGVRTLAALAFSELGDFAAPPPVGLSAALQDVDGRAAGRSAVAGSLSGL
jgi:hypothetical protein